VERYVGVFSTPKVMPAIALNKLLAINYTFILNFIRLAVL